MVLSLSICHLIVAKTSGEILVWTSLTMLAGTGGVMKAHPWIVASPLFTALLLIFVSGRPLLRTIHFTCPGSLCSEG